MAQKRVRHGSEKSPSWLRKESVMAQKRVRHGLETNPSVQYFPLNSRSQWSQWTLTASRQTWKRMSSVKWKLIYIFKFQDHYYTILTTPQPSIPGREWAEQSALDQPTLHYHCSYHCRYCQILGFLPHHTYPAIFWICTYLLLETMYTVHFTLHAVNCSLDNAH